MFALKSVWSFMNRVEFVVWTYTTDISLPLSHFLPICWWHLVGMSGCPLYHQRYSIVILVNFYFVIFHIIHFTLLWLQFVLIYFNIGFHYGLQYPFTEFKTGRNLRMSPIYPKLREAGAVFSQVMGYERPAYFDPTFGGMFHYSVLPGICFSILFFIFVTVWWSNYSTTSLTRFDGTSIGPDKQKSSQSKYVKYSKTLLTWFFVDPQIVELFRTSKFLMGYSKWTYYKLALHV